MKFIPNTDAADITGVTAGTLLDGGGTSGTVTLNVDLSEAAEAVIANGDYLLFLDGGATGTHAKESLADVATLFAGTGLTAASSVINVDAAQSGITSLGTLTGLTLDGNKGVTPGDGAMIHLDTSTITDTDTAETGTASLYAHVRLEGPVLAAEAPDVRTLNAATLYVHSSPSAGSNQTLDKRWGIYNNADMYTASVHNVGSYTQTAGDMTLYEAVNDANPTISLGSSATNRLEIQAEYNSGVQTLNEVNFTTYAASGTTHDGRFLFNVDEVQIANIHDTGITVYGTDGILSAAAGASLKAQDSAASSATAGGTLLLQSDDGAAMGDDHRLGVIEFKGAEDGSNTRSIGARIQAIARDAWDGSNNDADLEFYTTDGTTESKVLTLDADKLATFTGGVNSERLNKITNTTTSSATEGGMLNLISDDGAALGDDHRLGRLGFQAAEDTNSTIRQGASIEAFADAAWSAAENGTRLEFYTMDGNNSRELSLTLDSDLLATFAGGVTVTGTITGNVTGDLTGNASIGKGTRHYGSTIKILPSDFMINDDAAVPLSFKDGSNSGVHVNDTANEAIAFVAIPEGMKATAVDIYATHNKTVKVYEVDVNSSFDFTATADETGAANTQITVDPNINATATNYLAITVAVTATTNRIWGGLVTIAAQ